MIERFRISVFLILATACCVVTAFADQHDSHASSPLVDIVREATAPFLDANVAMAFGYVPKPFCVTGPDQGAMGVHLVNGGLVADGQLDPAKPESLVYEPRNGRLQLVAAEYIVLADAWHAQHPQPPTLFGQLLNYIAAPNRYGNPNFYEIHVWAWKENPFGVFVDWNPRASCADYAPQ
jgi:hypothetical protein